MKGWGRRRVHRSLGRAPKTGGRKTLEQSATGLAGPARGRLHRLRYRLKIILRDLKRLSDIVNNVLMPHPSVAHVRSSIVLDRLKATTKLPLRNVRAG